MKKNSHIIWVCPTSDNFFRGKGEVKPRTSSVLPKLSEKGLKITVLIPYDVSLLPKSKLAPSRITRHNIKLSQTYPVDFIKLTRAQVMPAIYMLKTPALEPALRSAVLSKSAIALAEQINRPVELFHLFDWEASLLPLFLEMEKEKDKKSKKIFDKTRTFLAVNQLRNQGTFAPDVLDYLAIPKTLFHPDGIEYYGQVSFLKTGLLFADGVGLVENATRIGGPGFANMNGLSGLLDSLVHKLRRWASGRSLKSHLDAYQELLSITNYKPLLPTLVRKLHTSSDALAAFVQSWGPVPADRYNTNMIGLLVQAPHKAFVFWEWAQGQRHEYGLRLRNVTSGHLKIIGRGLGGVGDFWLDVEPNNEYEIELLAWNGSAQPEVLLRSRRVRIPLDRPSLNKRAIFIDVRNKRRMELSGTFEFDELWNKLRLGSSLAFAFSGGFMPSSFLTKR